MPALKHIHQYKKIKKSKIFKCRLPGCSHYLTYDMVENAVSLCNRCDQPFIMSKKAMKLTNPHCEDCTVKKENKELEAIMDLVK